MSDTESSRAGQAVVVGEFTRPQAPDGGAEGPPVPSPASERLARWLPWLLPASLASPALHAPRLWLVVCLLTAYAAAIARHIKSEGAGPAGIVSAPFTALAGALKALVSPTVVIGSGLPILIALLGLCVVLPAVLTLVTWLLAGDGAGLLVAMRANVLQWGPALAAAGVCLCLLRTALGPERSGLAIQQRLASAPEIFLAAAAVAAVIWAVPMILSARPDALRVRDVSPSFVHETIDRWHGDWAQHQTDAVLECLEERSGVAWVGLVRAHADDPSRFRVYVGQAPGGSVRARLRSVTAVVLALHNQLPGSVDEIAVRRSPRNRRLLIDRSELDLTKRPVDEIDTVREASNSPAVLPFGPRPNALSRQCGARSL